jgi:uncharacterized protein (TIGR03000 family)
MGAPAPGTQEAPPVETIKEAPKKSVQGITSENQAHLVVELPANAKLYVDDHLMKSTSNRRSFVTPDLQLGQAYYYILRAEVERDGKTLAQSRRVTVRAGQSSEISFADMGEQSTTRAVARTDR